MSEKEVDVKKIMKEVLREFLRRKVRKGESAIAAMESGKVENMSNYMRKEIEFYKTLLKKLDGEKDSICKCGRTYKAHFIDDSYKTCEYLNDLKPKETVNHPEHYNMGKIEVIDFIEDQNLGFHEGNAVKYIARAKHKDNEEEDIKKAIWYLKRYLKREKWREAMEEAHKELELSNFTSRG